MAQTRSVPSFPVERDYRIFFIFMTAVMAGTYVLALLSNPALQQPWILIPFTLLLLIHIVAHWNVSRIILSRAGLLVYVLGQGLLAFVIVLISNQVSMVFALHMALIGETIGIVKSRGGLIASIAYFLALLMVNFILITGLEVSLLGLIGIIPAVVFVGLYVTLYNRQNEAREQAQALATKLEAANRQLTEYAARVEDLTIANERQRMARELHDTLSQGLAGLILQLEAADAHLGENRAEKARSIMANAMQQARATLADARRAIDDLRRSAPDDLDPALRLEISRFENGTGIPCEFHSEKLPPLPDAVKEIAVRTLAEALANVAKHARARNVTVEVDGRNGCLSLSVRDDGTGFEPASIPGGHYGLLGIRERVRLADGSFEIRSQPGQGAILRIQLPL